MLFYDYINDLLIKNPTQRIIQFEFNHKKYILKQPEKTSGAMRFLKGSPQKAFEREVARLKELILLKAPIPKVYLLNQRCIVMENGGQDVRSLLKNPLSDEQKQQILVAAAKTLMVLHRKNIVHGRPFLKDILWQEGTIKFIDFETTSHSKNMINKKIRDNLLFCYGLCCDKVSPQQMKKVTDILSDDEENKEIWRKTLSFIDKYSFIYYLLLPFKFIAKKDLMGIYILFETLSTKIIKKKRSDT